MAMTDRALEAKLAAAERARDRACRRGAEGMRQGARAGVCGHQEGVGSLFESKIRGLERVPQITAASAAAKGRNERRTPRP